MGDNTHEKPNFEAERTGNERQVAQEPWLRSQQQINRPNHTPQNYRYPNMQEMYWQHGSQSIASAQTSGGPRLASYQGGLIDLNDPRVQQWLQQVRAQQMRQQAMLAAQEQHHTPESHQVPVLGQLGDAQYQAMQPPLYSPPAVPSTPTPLPRQQPMYNPAGRYGASVLGSYPQTTPYMHLQQPQQRQNQGINSSINDGSSATEWSGQPQTPVKHYIPPIRASTTKTPTNNNPQLHINRPSAGQQPNTNFAPFSHIHSQAPRFGGERQSAFRSINSPAGQHRQPPPAQVQTPWGAPQLPRQAEVPQLARDLFVPQAHVQIPSYTDVQQPDFLQRAYSSNTSNNYGKTFLQHTNAAQPQIGGGSYSPGTIPGTAQKRVIEEVDNKGSEVPSSSSKRHKHHRGAMLGQPSRGNNEDQVAEHAAQQHNEMRLESIVSRAGNSTENVGTQDREVSAQVPNSHLNATPLPSERALETLPDDDTTSTPSRDNTMASRQRQGLPRYVSIEHKQQVQGATMARMPPKPFVHFVSSPEPDVDRWLLRHNLGGYIPRSPPLPVVKSTEENRELFDACDAFVQGLDEMRSMEHEDWSLGADEMMCTICGEQFLGGCPGH